MKPAEVVSIYVDEAVIDPLPGGLSLCLVLKDAEGNVHVLANFLNAMAACRFNDFIVQYAGGRNVVIAQAK